jgi:hypothetical protein
VLKIAALLLASGAFCLQLWGDHTGVATGPMPAINLMSRDGPLLGVNRLPAGKRSDSLLLSQADRPHPASGAHSKYRERIPRLHRVRLTWQPSSNGLATDDVAGYNVFRCRGWSTECAQINSEPVILPEYVDDQVRSGYTYYYTTTTVNRAGRQSPISNVVRAVIPFP